MDHVRRRLSLLLTALLAVWGSMAVAENFNITFAQGALAVWPITNSRTIAVGTVKPTIAVATGWQVTPWQEGKLYGVILQGQGRLAVQKNGRRWQIAEGATQLPRASALLLNDGWSLGGQPLTRISFNAGGSRWQVGLSAQPVREGQALVGVQRRLGKAPEATPPAPETVAGYAAIEPAAGLSPTLMPKVEVQALVQEILGLPGLVALTEALGNPYTPGTRVALPRVAVPGVALAPVAVASPSEISSSTMPISATEAKPEEAQTAEAEAHGSESSETKAETTAEVSRTLPPVVREVASMARSEEAPTDDVGVLIPPRGKNFLSDISEALQAVADAPVGSTAAREARLALAGIYLAWQRPEEAQRVLATLPLRTDGLPAQAVPRLLWGLADLARIGVPQEGVFDQGGTLATHAKLWAAVAANARGAHSTAATEWPTERGILPDYPDYLRALAQTAHVNALVMTGQFSAALKALKGLEEGYGQAGLPANLQRLKGLAQLGSNQPQEGLEALAAAAENTRDGITAAQAKLEFIRILHRRKEISDAQLRGYLRDLQQEWRGNDTERQTLVALADLYEKAREPSNALQTWQTLVQAFPQAPDMATLTSRMAQAFVDVFDPEAERTYDPLTYLGLYYDFRELLPNDERGDLVQERMAEALVKANLFDRAAPILEQQLQYRPLEPVAQGRLALLLAQTYRNQDKAEDALKLLEARRPLATTQMLRRGWALEEARNLATLNRPQAAAEVLKPLLAEDRLEDKEALQLAADVAYQGQDWANAVTGYTRLISKIPASLLVSETTAQLQVFHLAYALAQQNDAEALATLKRRYQDAWPDLPQLADALNAIAASSGVTGMPPEGGPLQQLTTALSGINSLDDQIAQTRRQMERTREDRNEYNRRMQYMELLPPPAL
jgi:hypothetical protein